MPLKSDVLSVLLNNRNKDISGQDLADQFGVSRNAVWKAINSLKHQGYEIISSTNKGYRLSPDCDILSSDEIKAYLDDKSLEIYTYDTLDSTNNEAKRLLIDNSKSNFVITAENQTSGRGRFGRDFYSKKEMGLYFSLVLSPDKDFNSIVGITSYAAVCVADAITELTKKSPQIKWVNDIFIDGKKVCGILTEAVSDFESGNVSNIVIGIGINIKACKLPEKLKSTVGFLNYNEPVKNRLSAVIINKLLEFSTQKNNYIDKYKQYSMILGKEISYIKNGCEFHGTAADIDSSGGLLVVNGNKSEILKSGEISIKMN